MLHWARSMDAKSRQAPLGRLLANCNKTTEKLKTCRSTGRMSEGAAHGLWVLTAEELMIPIFAWANWSIIGLMFPPSNWFAEWIGNRTHIGVKWGRTRKEGSCQRVLFCCAWVCQVQQIWTVALPGLFAGTHVLSRYGSCSYAYREAEALNVKLKSAMGDQEQDIKVVSVFIPNHFSNDSADKSPVISHCRQANEMVDCSTKHRSRSGTSSWMLRILTSTLHYRWIYRGAQELTGTTAMPNIFAQ